MRFKILNTTRRNLARGCAVFVLGAVSAGCSSGVARFDDGLFTASTSNEQEIARAEPVQTYPGDTMQTSQDTTRYAAASPAPTGSAQPVARAALAPATNAQPAQMPASNGTAGTLPPPSNTASRPPAGASTAASEPAASGTRVTIRPGDTLQGLSRRYNVPADTIMKANALSNPNLLVVGRTITIPGATGPTQVAATGPNAGTAQPGTLGTLPAPAPGRSSTPDSQVAVLPQVPKPKQPDDTIQTSADKSARTGTSGTEGTYTVAAGDTLFAIARKTGTDVARIKEANGMSNGLLRVGQVLTIPAATGPSGITPVQEASTKTAQAQPAARTVGEGAAVQPAAYTPPQPSAKSIQEASLNADAAAPDATGIARMRWPVRGRVISNYGQSDGAKNNDGIDIAVPTGSPIKAAENGVVIYAGDGLKEFGNTVLVRHEDGLVTVYGHASELRVSRGDNVRRGQEIALAGMSGATDTPKLHFEVRKDSVPVDPKTYLEGS